MNTEFRFVEGEDKPFQGKESDPNLFVTRIADQVLRLPEDEFWKLVSTRLNVPISETNRNELEAKDREYWSWNYLLQKIFLQIAPLKVLVTHKGKEINIYKYYSQALRLWKFIPIVKPQVEFVINTSDLTVRILAELKALGPEESQQVLKLAVVQIFENIVGPKYTHGSIVRNLSVRLDG